MRNTGPLGDPMISAGFGSALPGRPVNRLGEGRKETERPVRDEAREVGKVSHDFMKQHETLSILEH